MQEQHRSFSTKCVGLELAKVSANEKQVLLKSSVAKLEKKVAAYKKPSHTTHQAPPPAFLPSAGTNENNMSKKRKDTN